MITRSAKVLVLAAVALLFSLIVFNNLADFDSNYQFVRHVLSMDTLFTGSRNQGRAILSPAVHLAFYLGIIALEIATALLLWWGVVSLLRGVRQDRVAFNAAKRIPLLALTLSMLLWLAAFLAVGGEWFLMWQSHLWNGQEEAFRMFVVTALAFLMLLQPETEGQP